MISSVDKEEDKTVDLDDVLVKFNIFGCYHRVSIVLLTIAYITNAWYCVNYIFTVEEVSYRCKDSNLTAASCDGANQSQTCSEWIYDNPNSFVAEFGLACQEWKRTLVGTVHSIGYMAGLLIVGPMSDRFGRKITIVTTGVAGGVLGLTRSFTTWYCLYITLEFLEAAIGDICSPAFMLAIEMVATKKRVPFNMILSFGYSLGGMTLALLAWLFPYYRTFLRVLYAPALLFYLYKYLLDESSRWLLSKGRYEEGIAVIQKAANMNKVQLDEKVLQKVSFKKEEAVGFIDLFKLTFKSATLVKRFFVCLVWWTTCTFVNYGLVINSVSLQGDKYWNYALLSLVEAPALIIIVYVLKYFKRKISLMSGFCVGAILCLVQPFVPTNLPWLSITLYMAGKLMSSFYFNITYIYTSELFPTYTRNSMHALCSSIGRIGSILAPQTPLLMRYWKGLPSMFFGGAALIAGIVTFLVPDTAEDSLPDTVEQAKNVGNRSNIYSKNLNSSEIVQPKI